PKLGLLRAMESFDERTQTATPGALMTHNVVEYRPRPERAESTLDAIAISLDETRRIDLDRVAGLLDMDTAAAREAVLEHAFVDPESGELVSAVAYLSGDVRAKLTLLDKQRRTIRHYHAMLPSWSWWCLMTSALTMLWSI